MTGPAVVARQTLPPAQPLLEAPRPIYRGQSPGFESDGSYNRPATVRPGYLPDYVAASERNDRAGDRGADPPRVQLGTPQFEVAPLPPPMSGELGSRGRQDAGRRWDIHSEV